MLLPIVLNSMNNAMKEQQVNEILQMNDESRRFGLALTATEAVQVLEARNKYLQYIGRIELGIEVSKSIISSFCKSTYITPEEYAATIHELHEVFYYMKSETEDKIGDEALIKIIREYFDDSCGGSLELLKGKLQAFADEFKKKNWLTNLVPEEESD